MTPDFQRQGEKQILSTAQVSRPCQVPYLQACPLLQWPLQSGWNSLCQTTQNFHAAKSCAHFPDLTFIVIPPQHLCYFIWPATCFLTHDPAWASESHSTGCSSSTWLLNVNCLRTHTLALLLFPKLSPHFSQGFSNLSIYQHHVKGLLTHRLLSVAPTVPGIKPEHLYFFQVSDDGDDASPRTTPREPLMDGLNRCSEPCKTSHPCHKISAPAPFSTWSIPLSPTIQALLLFLKHTQLFLALAVPSTWNSIALGLCLASNFSSF